MSDGIVPIISYFVQSFVKESFMGNTKNTLDSTLVSAMNELELMGISRM